MKKIYLVFAVLITMINEGFAQTICVIDPAAQTSPGISPPPSEIPCVVAGENYNQVIQVKNFSTIESILPVASMSLDSIIGLPAGLDWIESSGQLNGGQNGCLTFFGTTTAASGVYTLSWYGTVTVTAPLLGNESYTGNLSTYANDIGGSAFNYHLTVINPGDQCPNAVAGINTLSADLNSAIYVYPNPSNGVFEFRLNAGERIKGQIAIYDITGNKVFEQQLDVIGYYITTIDLSRFAKGLYTLQLRTADGFASKRISVQ